MCILQWNDFREQFPQNHKPKISDLEAYWNRGIAELFQSLAEHLLQEYDLRFGIPVWSEKYGWTYRIGKSGVYLINGIRIAPQGFFVDGIQVNDADSYELLLKHIKDVYTQNKHRLETKIAEKNLRQAERNKKRIDREQKEFAVLQSRIIPEKYNVFRWPSKLDIGKLKRLYILDAKGIQHMELADEIGLALYLRCKYGKEDMERMERGIIRCHNCESELKGTEDFRQCACGFQYSYREYRRSYRGNNMPSGAAAEIFERFIHDWSLADSYQQKIILIDTLLHEFHRSLVSGAAHRPVAINFIDGTKKRVEAVIRDLSGVQ